MIYTRNTSATLQVKHQLCSSVISQQSPIASAGFTLLELLVVITLLAILASGAMVAYDGIEEQGNDDAARFEMAEIRKALIKFRRDSGSNALPAQGIYDCDDDPTGDSNTPNTALTFPSHTSTLSNSDLVSWCKHPANFWMLFTDPLGRSEKDQWNEDTKRGWNGPYLQRKNGYVSVGNNIGTTGSGSPFSGSEVENIWGISSPFEYQPNNDLLAWYPNIDSNSSPSTDNITEYSQFGTPYFLFDLHDQSKARLVSLSVDHTYNGLGTEACTPPLDIATNEPLDHVLCLLK